MISGGNITIIGVLMLVVHLLGVFNAAHAIMNVRLAQSAVAWSICLVTFPWLTIPLYWALGRRKFHGYATVYRRVYSEYNFQTEQISHDRKTYEAHPDGPLAPLNRLATRFTDIPFTCGNGVTLLIDGDATFEALLKAIASAQDYILFQFYIIEDDDSGQRFQHALIDKAKQGVRVYVLYDEVGSAGLPWSYVQRFRQADIAITKFNSTRGLSNRFQINFRNHRKVVVVDGNVGFVGGLNIGDEYLGKDPRYGNWRDTHIQLIGPSVKALQLSFVKDWYWAVRQAPAVKWTVDEVDPANETVLVLSTGPSDEFDACPLVFNSLINLAQTRLWIATPYFVPDESTLMALKLAALRGVDVRILLPGYPDHLIVYLCSFSYYNELRATGIQLYRYHKGFMHQKALVVDDQIAGVGTVNLDNRSFWLNFEIMAFVTQGHFLQDVTAMLQRDFDVSNRVDLQDYARRSLGFRLAVRAARLLAPLQ